MDPLDTIIGAAFGGAFTLLGAFWNGYLNKKAEHTAEAEDTELITRIQEAVKVEFQKQIATLTAQLQTKNDINEELRSAIYDYNSNLHDLAENLYSYPFEPFDSFDKFFDKHDAYKKSLSKVTLLLNENDFDLLEEATQAKMHELRHIQAQYKTKELNLKHKISRAEAIGDHAEMDKLQDQLAENAADYITEHQPIQSDLAEDVDDLRRVLSRQFKRPIT